MKVVSSLALVSVFAASAVAQEGRGYIRENTVLPVILEQDLRLRDAQAGDRVTARLEDDRYLPSGTRLEGEILAARQANGDRPAYIEFRFDRMVFPNGRDQAISATPIAWDKRNLSQDRDGRFVAKGNDKRRKENSVLGGAVGGLVLGALVKKPGEGLLLGTLAGILVAETGKKSTADLTLARGTKIGAWFSQPFTVQNWDRNQIIIQDEDYYRRDRIDEREISVECDDRRFRYSQSEAPYREGDRYFLPLRRTAEQLDFEVDRISDDVVYIHGENGVLRLTAGSRDIRLNGKRRTLKDAVQLRGKEWFVPADAFALISPKAIRINGKDIDYDRTGSDRIGSDR